MKTDPLSLFLRNPPSIEIRFFAFFKIIYVKDKLIIQGAVIAKKH